MSSSPYLTPEMKQYIKENQIEETLNTLINQLLKGRYADPYSFLVQSLEEKCSSDITIISIKAFETFNCEGIPVISLLFKCLFRLKPVEMVFKTGVYQILDVANNLYDSENLERYQGKGLSKACNLINSVLNGKLKSSTCQNQKKIDDLLISFYEEKEKTVANVVNAVSFSMMGICSKLYNLPLYQYLRGFSDCVKKSKNKPPVLIINVLQGSKLVNSKCKFFKYQIILDNEKSAPDNVQTAQKIIHNVRKAIVSSKGGESALKFAQDGSFICHLDTILDNFKVLEEAVNSSGFKEDVKIGLVVQADNFYIPEQKKYELENPKKPEDTDQMIEYLFKLCNDKQLIGYLEDPLAEEDVEGWRKLLLKFKDSKVEIGSRKLYSNLAKMKQWTDPPEKVNENDQKKNIYLSRCFYKYSDFLTLSELFALHKQITSLQKIKYMILSENLLENNETSIVDLAFALENVALNLNPPIKFERIEKFNRYIELSEYERSRVAGN